MSSAISTGEDYARAVLAGEIVTCEYTKLACRRYFNDLDHQIEKRLHFDRAAANRAIHFYESLSQTKGRWAGQKLKLEPWQKFIVWNIFGWKRADGTRRFRYVYLDMGRKNGKTALAAGTALYFLFADGEPRAEVYSVASVRDQAKICFNDSKSIVTNTPGLGKRITPFANSLVHEPSGSMYKALSSDAGIQDGYSPSCVIVDEYHAHPNNDMFDVMKSGMGAREQPLMFIITTAGFNRQYPCYEFRNNCINILHGIVEDDSVFTAIYTLDEGDDWDNPNNLIKSNPNLGVSVSKEYLLEQIADAKNRPSAVRNVKTKNCNIWVDADKTWILDEQWMMNCGDDARVERLRGCACFAGLDLANVSDMVAYVLMFHEDDKYQVLPFFWIPEEALAKKIKESNASFGAWVEQGYVRVTPGNVTDYDYVQADILRINEVYDVKSTAYDRWNSSQTIIDLTNEGLEMSPFGQGYGSMSAPTKELERLVLTGQLEHFGNPVLRWMMASVAIAADPAGNIKPDKRKSTQKIDGVVAMVMALGEMMTAMSKDDENPYASRGMLSL